MAIAAPADGGGAFLADFATSTISMEVELAAGFGRPLVPGWALDQEGRETADPQAVFEGGGLTSLGRRPELGSYKGYARAAAVDVFCGILTGAAGACDWTRPAARPAGWALVCRHCSAARR